MNMEQSFEKLNQGTDGVRNKLGDASGHFFNTLKVYKQMYPLGNVVIPVEKIKTMTTQELRDMCDKHGADYVKMKKVRRTVQNRQYARDSRFKKQKEYQDLLENCRKMEQILKDLTRENDELERKLNACRSSYTCNCYGSGYNESYNYDQEKKYDINQRSHSFRPVTLYESEAYPRNEQIYYEQNFSQVLSSYGMDHNEFRNQSSTVTSEYDTRYNQYDEDIYASSVPSADMNDNQCCPMEYQTPLPPVTQFYAFRKCDCQYSEVSSTTDSYWYNF